MHLDVRSCVTELDGVGDHDQTFGLHPDAPLANTHFKQDDGILKLFTDVFFSTFKDLGFLFALLLPEGS